MTLTSKPVPPAPSESSAQLRAVRFTVDSPNFFSATISSTGTTRCPVAGSLAGSMVVFSIVFFFRMVENSTLAGT